MHNLALALHDKGYQVSGSDDAIFEPSYSRLQKKGLLPAQMGWDAARITADLDAVILGMHAKGDNPELIRAQELGLAIYSYPEFLYQQSQNKTRVVIGGSHGKTTITSMVLHVMNYHQLAVDYMVGAQLEGFDNMVHLTEDNEFIVLEGDEYLSSALDLRPKFHLYQPNIALISGIAWDHVNVFPTFENYVEQFAIFIQQITNGGILIYNQEDPEVAKLAAASTHTIRKIPYTTPAYDVQNGQTLLDTPEGPMPIQVFGKHNLSNLAGAKWICQAMGVDEADFYEAIASFKGASKRLELLAETPNKIAYKDFAHSPSKVAATTRAVKEQYPNRKLIACLELHTYSSLTPTFLKEYEGALAAADEALVYYSPEAVAIKKLDPLTDEQIATAFNRPDLKVYTSPAAFHAFVAQLQDRSEDFALLLMSSGNYGGLDFGKIPTILAGKM